MNELAPRLTDNGKAYIINALNGDGIVFTKIVLGNGVPTAGTVTSVASPLIEIGLTDIDIYESYCVLTGKFDNSNVAQGFYMTELGVMAKNTAEEEVLYAYRYRASEIDYIPSADSGNVMETEITVIVSIGDAEDVTAVLIEGSLYATKEELNNHLNAVNPHNIDKRTVGLEKVENLVFGQNVPVIRDLEDAENIENGDTLDVIVSKLKFWLRVVAESKYIPISGYGDTTKPSDTGISGDLWFTNAIRQNYPHGIGGYMSRNDIWRIVSAGDLAVNPTGNKDDYSDCGYLEIATGDNGTEPIIVRQYTNGGTGVDFENVVRTLYLLDHKGNTKIPGELQFFGGYRGIKWSDSAAPKEIGTTQGDGAYVGLVSETGKFVFEIGVADDVVGENVVVRQRKNIGTTGPGIGGNWGSIPIARTAYLLNGEGNTIFPGSCTATSHPTSSDLKKKDVHGEVDLATAEALIMGLAPIWYNFKDDWKESAGFGAQDVYSLVHELGMVDSGLYRAGMKPDEGGSCDGVEYHDSDIEAHDDSEIEWNLNYTEFIPYMVRVIQSQQVRIETMEQRLEALEHELGGGY